MASKRAKIATKPTPERKGIIVRADGREVRRLMTYLPPDLADRLERYAFENGRRQLADVISEAVERFLEDQRFR